MATDFRVFLYRNSENLHLKLNGYFDGSSAYQLVGMIKKYGVNGKNVYIHTSTLSFVHPFGVDVFKQKFIMDNLKHSLTFTGKYADTMALHGSRVI